MYVVRGDRRRAPFLWGGAAAGAVVAGLLVVAENRRDRSDYADLGGFLIVPAMAVGAGLGAGLGYIVYRATEP